MDVQTLFLTNRDDVSIEYLISKFRLHTENYLRINSEDIELIEFLITPSQDYRCYIDNCLYDLNNVMSVVFKRVPAKYNLDTNDENRAYLNNEKKHFLEGLYLSMENAKWINPMFATHIAERKLFQLKIASKIGLKIPSSIITNKLSFALEFIEANRSTIIKPISNGLQILKDKTFSIYTTEVNSEMFRSLNLSETFETPVFLQEKINNCADIRVTIVGNKIFPVSIKKESNEVDWRKPEILKKYQSILLPDVLNKKLLDLNNYFGMVYSAIDLILTPQNEYIFLEINPVGEWVWLENELGLNISDYIIKELL